MGPQVDKASFKQALIELGHDPYSYEGKRLTITSMCQLYEFYHDFILDAIDRKELAAHYDYMQDTIWLDALDAAHYYYCLKTTKLLYQAV